MADSNSYRRKAETYKRALMAYENRIENNIDFLLDHANSTEIAVRRDALIRCAQDNIRMLLSRMRELRGY